MWGRDRGQKGGEKNGGEGGCIFEGVPCKAGGGCWLGWGGFLKVGEAKKPFLTRSYVAAPSRSRSLSKQKQNHEK